MKPNSKVIAFIAMFFITTLSSPFLLFAQDQDPNQQNQNQNQDPNQQNQGQDPNQDQGNVSYQTFYDALSPYGQWVNDPTYGYIWIPNDVGPEFAPYGSHGYWASTDQGWTWVSSFPWGWAPFHYGRWDYESTYGWYWIPGYEWAPAWVEWSYEPGFYGWAPLGPGIGIDVALAGGYHPSMKRWCFMDERHMGDQHIHRYFVPRAENGPHIARATFIHNSYNDPARHSRYIAGPPRDEVQRFRDTPVPHFEVRDQARPGHSVSGNQINIYRPRIDNNTRNVARPPAAQSRQDVKPVQQRYQDYRQTHPIQPTDRPQPGQQPQQRQQPQPQMQQRQQPQQQPRPQPQQQRPQPQPQRQQPQMQQRSQPQMQQRSQPQMQRSAPPSGGGGRRR